MPKLRRVVEYGLLLGSLALVIFTWIHRNSLYDWYRLRNYTPSSQIASIASQTTMTPYAKHMFYVNKPGLEDRNKFSSNCPINGGEHTIILGCYHSHQTGIFLFDVKDARLNGVMQVTASHETLHAIYGRLSSSQKAYINGLLEDFYKHDVKDKELINTINAYKKSEPNDVVNEMHSIFGTEVVKLTPALETYYKQYFTNRQAVVGFANKYRAVFTKRKDQVKADDALLKSTAAQIGALRASLGSQLTAINSQKANMDALLAANQRQQYNAQVDSFNAKVAKYNQDAASARSLIQQYNTLLISRNAIALEENQLYQSIDSKPSNISGQ